MFQVFFLQDKLYYWKPSPILEFKIFIIFIIGWMAFAHLLCVSFHLWVSYFQADKAVASGTPTVRTKPTIVSFSFSKN